MHVQVSTVVHKQLHGLLRIFQYTFADSVLLLQAVAMHFTHAPAPYLPLVPRKELEWQHGSELILPNGQQVAATSRQSSSTSCDISKQQVTKE